MVFQGIPKNDEIFQWAENPENAEAPLKFGKEKIEAIKESITEIESLIDGRETLSKEIFTEGEKLKTEINNYLMEKKVHEDPNDMIDPKEKVELRKKKIEISELQLNEKVSCWKDVALLKKELRERQRELNDKLGRIEALDKILE
jgi:cell division protein YceG involved in septum cleavage